MVFGNKNCIKMSKKNQTAGKLCLIIHGYEKISLTEFDPTESEIETENEKAEPPSLTSCETAEEHAQ